MRRLKNKKIFINILKFLGLFFVILVLVYLAVNGPALYQRLKYKTEKSNLRNARQALHSNLNNRSATLPDRQAGLGLQEDCLVIPKIEIEAPIIFSESMEEKDITEDLKNGVIHYPDTALPGEEGNCVITGHSSDFWWRKGQYKTIFALLNELEIGDLIIVHYDRQKFIYKMTDKNIVSSDDIDILSQKIKTPLDGEKPILTLFTCWPLGTDLKRLVVMAELVN